MGETEEINDLIGEIAELPRSLLGQWFDERLLDPEQRRAHHQAERCVRRVIRQLFERGLVDVGNDATYGEGVRRFHRRMWEAQQDPGYWKQKEATPSAEQLERSMALHQELMETRKFSVAREALRGDVRTVGLTAVGCQWRAAQAAG
jgi:hypothetical protein